MRVLKNILAVLVVLALFGCASKSSNFLKEMPDSVEFEPPKPVSWRMDNGLTVFFLQDSELPLVGGTLYMRGGALWTKPNESAQVTAMGSLMRSGGAGSLSADNLDRKLEELSASVSSSFGDEHGSVSFFSLEGDFDEVFDLFADVILRPRFEESRRTLWVGQSLESIRRRKDDGSTIASISFQELLYGRNSQYGYVSVQEDIKNISKQDLVRHHKKFVRPNEAILAVSGSISKEKLQAALERSLGNWEPRKTELGDVPGISFETKPAVYFVEGPFTQSTIYMGHRGVERLSPDFMEIEVFNDVFGSGGFGSRLMKTIRSQKGLAYGVYGAIQAGVVEGRNVIVVKTKAESAGEALIGSLDELKRMQDELISKTELQNTVRSRENSFVFRFDSPGQIIERSALLELLGYPKDYDATYLDKLRAVKREGVLEVANKRWDLGDMVVVVVGNQEAFQSVKQALAKPDNVLADLALHKVNFDERLESDAVF